MDDAPTAARLLRDARHRSGLTQAQLAQRAGATQSVVSAYESGGRQPSVPVISRLVRAADLELVLSVRTRGKRRHRTPVASRVRASGRAIKEVAARHGLTNVRLFGSVARGEQTAGSDVDLLVDAAPEVGLLDLVRCQREIEMILGVAVDLVPADSLRAGVARGAVRDARPL